MTEQGQGLKGVNAEEVVSEAKADDQEGHVRKSPEEQGELFSGLPLEEGEGEEASPEEPPLEEEPRKVPEEPPPAESPPAGEEKPEDGLVDMKEAMDFVVRMSSEPIPKISPELTQEQIDSHSESWVEEYNRNRRIEIVEAKDFLRNVQQQANGLVSMIHQSAGAYSYENAPLTPKAIFDHMKEFGVSSPVIAARSASYEASLSRAYKHGETEALKKVKAPTNPAKPMPGHGRRVVGSSTYKTQAEAHAGGVHLLDSLRKAREGR